MAFNFKIPILVRKTALSEGGKPDYIVKSVFVNYPIGTHRRVEEATTRFLKQLNKHLKAFALNRERAEDWLWYAFNPADLKLKTVRVTGKAGKQFFNGDVTVITFTVQNSIFVTLPSFNSLIFSISDMKELGIQTETIVLKTLKSWLDDNDYIDIKQYYAIAGEYLTNIEISSSVKYESFNFGETKQTDFFSFFNNTSSFVGSDEIEKVGYSLNDLYPTQLKRAWLRDELVEHLHGILYNGENTPIVIVGSAGVGKKSILQEAVFRYLETHKNKDSDELPKIWHIDPLRVISGMSVVGQWEQRFESILDYVSKRPIENGKHIIDKVLIDNTIALLRIGQSAHNSLHLADVLKHYLEKRSFQLVMIATQQEWKILQEKDRRYADMFQVIRVQEPNIAEAAAMTFELRNTLETEYECIITAQALSLTFDIHKRFMRHRALPGSVADMLRRLANKHKYGQIDYPEVFSEFSQYSGLRENIFDGNIVLEEQEVDKQVEELLVGQPDAVRCISDVVNLVKARLNAPGKPLASLMFIGPTGVGKTQAAKVLSEYLLGSEDRLMRFDMNEYVSADQAMRLIGDMHNPEGLLTGKVRHNPFGIILLDEIEKADPSVLDLLLQVLDDGRLTDSLGRTVDFSNTIIIMTSNLGAIEASHRLGFSQENRDDESVYRKAVQNTFRPEFINRIDRFVVFKPLSFEHTLGIAQLQIQELLNREGFIRRTTLINISPQALHWVAQRGYDSRMGGRALKRQIERDLTALSAEQLVKTNLETPIIFDIYLDNDKLVPRIKPLTFAQPLNDEWLPLLPSEANGRKGFGLLKKEIEQILNLLDDENEVESTEWDWLFYRLKDQASEIKTKLQELTLGLDGKYFETISVILLRLNNTPTANLIFTPNAKEGKTKGKSLVEDKLFTESALQELQENYQYAVAQFDRLQSLYLNYFLDTKLIHIQAKGFRAGLTDEIEMNFEPLMAQNGSDEYIEYLIENYKKLFRDLDVEHSVEGNTIHAEGYALYDLLKGEHGYHLFYRSHLNPLLIKLDLKLLNEEVTKLDFQVIRLYNIWRGVQNKYSTLTDLRSGYTNFANIHPQELKLLLYANIVGSAK